MAENTSSPTLAKATITSNFKEFRCTWGTCTKSFSRAEHLHRHALNHDETRANNTCLRCSAVFKRGDLLDRHMIRHREKDDEAGGEGLGRLQTRKRLWRDSTGAVVAKRRPEHEKKKCNPSTSPPKAFRAQVRAGSESHGINAVARSHNEPLSPPKSLQDQAPIEDDVMDRSQIPSITATTHDIWPMPSSVDDSVLPGSAPPIETFDFLCNASWGTQSSSEVNESDVLYSDLFAPDTASSFNMPFTTMNYYNWLFGNENCSVSGYDTLNSARNSKLSTPGNLLPSLNHSTPSSDGRGLSMSDASGEYGRNNQRYDYSSYVFKDTRTTSDYSSGSYSQEPTPETSAANQILAMSQMAELNMAAALGYSNESASIARNYMPCSPDIPTPIIISDYSKDPTSRACRPIKSRKLPVVSEKARQGILDFVLQARPKDIEGLEIPRDHPLLSLGTLQRYCNLYFSRFNVSYPLIHLATFDPSSVDPLLLISVVLLGATFDDKESHLFAICVHDVMRAQIFRSCAFTTRPTLWMLQTILLVECFGKSRAGQLQHDMSHLFHGLLINLIRRSDCQSARSWPFDESEAVNVDRRWKAEVDAEQKRRLALFCFMWDTQHAVLFSQSLCMNAAELKLTLPWNEALWDAETPEEWCAINAIEQPQPQYLAVLKTYINQRGDTHTQSLNALSRVLMLHGLMSVAWDLNRRDQTSLGISIVGKDEPWQLRMARSYDAWKADFDIYSKEVLHSLEDGDDYRQDFQKFCVATLAVYHAAHIILQVELNDLQIYAGAGHIIGRPVTKTDRDRSRQRVERWAQPPSISAATAGSHAALLLRDGIRKLKNWDAGDVFHYPWCLYLATLTCWAFQTCSKNLEGPEDGLSSDNEDDNDWDARAEMSALISAMTRSNLEDLWKVAGKYRTADLPRIMAKHLSSIRWAVMREGMLVLRGLSGRGRIS